MLPINILKLVNFTKIQLSIFSMRKDLNITHQISLGKSSKLKFFQNFFPELLLMFTD